MKLGADQLHPIFEKHSTYKRMNTYIRRMELSVNKEFGMKMRSIM